MGLSPTGMVMWPRGTVRFCSASQRVHWSRHVLHDVGDRRVLARSRCRRLYLVWVFWIHIQV